MTALASSLARDSLLPRPPGGLAPGALLALLVHSGLIAALALSVQWRSASVDVVSAELWSSVPQTAAPRAVETLPPPPVPTPPAVVAVAPLPKAEPAIADAQIAIERARRDKEDRDRTLKERNERDKAERDREAAAADKLKLAEAADKLNLAEAADKLKLAEAAKKRDAAQRADEQRLAEQREANLKRMLGQAGASGSPSANGTALRDAGPSAGYAGRVAKAIRDNIRFSGTVPGNPAAEVDVTATASGTIIARRLRKSSGNKEWDDAVLRAIDRTGNLPADTDGRVPTSFLFSLRLEE